ncbi:MAG TPA: energy transducer TonB [Steroidobacteraceae bacterium]|jgi:protein TonB|nr:energy transducer TonB [Steroidobacteraceae bacterium]
MPKSLRKHELIAPEAEERPVLQPVKKQKLPVLLVTEDESLWPQVGADLNSALVLKQLDSIDELISSTPSGQAAIVLWDARNHPEPAAVLSRLHLHSSRFAIVALDEASSADAWTLPVQHRQIVAHLAVPIVGSILTGVLDSAHEEVNSRLALLGDGSVPLAVADGTPKKPWLVPAVIGGVLAAAVGAYLLSRGGATVTKPAPITAARSDKTSAAAVPAVKPAADADEKVDALIDKAQQAMLDRHFIDPLAGSALSLYREVLIVKPDNGEARQGLQRLSEILIARVQSALDERKFDIALQFLETARSIDANDKRLVALDEKIASLRAELGPAQILAALNAQNFDRAAQLIDEAVRTKALPAAKLAQLREEVRRRREDFEVARLLKLVETRVQQDHLIDPRNDSAVYYLDQAKQAGAAGPALQAQVQELDKRMTQMARGAIQQRNFSEADRILTEMHGIGAPQAALSSLQRELNAARNSLAAQKPETPPYLELAQSRLTQGKLTDPDNDSAFFYVNQLRAADPKNGGLAQILNAVQVQILDRARTALDAGDVEKSEALLQKAASLGASPDLDALSDRIRKRKAGGDVLQMPEQSLTRLNKLDVQYPTRALQNNVEGSVEIGYTVAADGSVGNVKVLNADPPRTFETAATKAVSHLRYQPVIQGGKAIAVGTQVRIVFRVPK